MSQLVVPSSTALPDIPQYGEELLTHESKIPPIASKIRNRLDRTTNDSHAQNAARTSLSFALPSSLAFFKRLTWELTPTNRPRIDADTAAVIAARFPPERITAEAVENAFCLGVAFTNPSSGLKNECPHLYVVFPHAHRDVTDDMKFMHLWHDQALKPAFDLAWIESKLVHVYEKEHMGDTSLVTDKTAPKAEIAFKDVGQPGYHGSPRFKLWPHWRDEWAYSQEHPFGTLTKGLEGGWSDMRARVLMEAWTNTVNMVKGERKWEMSDPILLAVWDKKVEVANEVSLVKAVGMEWDGFVDSRFVEEGDFVVLLDHERQIPVVDGQDGRNDVDPEASENSGTWMGTVWTLLGW